VLKITGLRVEYGPFLAIGDVSLDVAEGEILGLIGPNGAGKSSLVRVVAGLVTPRSGRVVFLGRNLLEMAPHERINAGLSVVPEGRGIFPVMSVEENLLMGGYALVAARRARERRDEMYALFPVLAERRRQMGGTLSGGQQQILAIAMGLMTDPSLLILDEPSLGLAPIVIDTIAETLRAMRARKLTVLLAEQNAGLTAAVADRVAVIQHGSIRFTDTAARLLDNPDVAESLLAGI
jgi:branched-chain amino acid transport system ATP-binding protein